MNLSTKPVGNLTFEEFVERVETRQVQVVFQLVVGRGGSLFLHSLLDNHPQILSYPGMLNFYESVAEKSRQPGANLKKIISDNIFFWNEIMAPYNIHKELGPDKNISIETDGEKIASLALGFAGERSHERKILFLAVHFAIGVCFNRDMSAVRMIYSQEHTSYPRESGLDAALYDFPAATFMCMIRDPRSNYLAIKAWEKKRHSLLVKAWEVSQYQPGMFADLCIYWYSRMLRFASGHHSRFLFIRLEDLQSARAGLMKKIALHFKLDYHPSMTESTFSGYAWHGDSFSPKKQGFRTSASPSNWQSGLSAVRKMTAETILNSELAALQYPLLYRDKKWTRLIAWIFMPLWLWDDLSKIFKKNFYYTVKLKGHSRSLYDSILEHLRNTASLVRFTKSRRSYPDISKAIFSLDT